MNDKELYREIEFLHFNDDCDCCGCYYKGHINMEQFKRVAKDFMLRECEKEQSDNLISFKKGYYKVLPNGTMRLFKDKDKVRGSFPVMECIYL